MRGVTSGVKLDLLFKSKNLPEIYESTVIWDFAYYDSILSKNLDILSQRQVIQVSSTYNLPFKDNAKSNGVLVPFNPIDLKNGKPKSYAFVPLSHWSRKEWVVNYLLHSPLIMYALDNNL